METKLETYLGQLITIGKAARMLDVSTQMVRVWVDQKRLRCLRIPSDGPRLFHRQDVADFKFTLAVERALSGREKPGPKSDHCSPTPDVVELAQERLARVASQIDQLRSEHRSAIGTLPYAI